MSLRPFFTFYGGKWRAAPHYPVPANNTIVEPFAGSAGYSLRYPFLKIILVEKDPAIAATWRYLIRVSKEEILGLPDLWFHQTVDDLDVCPEARLLIGWWLHLGAASPAKSFVQWARLHWAQDKSCHFWGDRARKRIASQVDSIRHWTIIEGDYSQAPDIPATWFIDPPYSVAGKPYRHGPKGLDYAALADWCRTRRGQVIVCENVGADWLPFRPWRDILANTSPDGGKVSQEAIWTSADETTSPIAS